MNEEVKKEEAPPREKKLGVDPTFARGHHLQLGRTPTADVPITSQVMPMQASVILGGGGGQEQIMLA